MKEHGLYILNADMVRESVRAAGGQFHENKARPVYCCVQDKRAPGLYYAIPTSDWRQRTPQQQQKILGYDRLPQGDFRRNYYHIGETNRTSVFLVSDMVPITAKHIDHAFTVNDRPVVIQDKKLIADLRAKTTEVLRYEARNPNKLRQHISAVRDNLTREVQREIAPERVATSKTVEPARPLTLRERAAAAQREINANKAARAKQPFEKGRENKKERNR